MSEIELEFEGISKTFQTAGKTVAALADINLQVAAGELVCLLGPSGCGKSTLLHIAAGLERPTSGRVYAKGRPVTQPSRHLGMVFQQYSLLPWLNVFDNVAFGFKVSGARNYEDRVSDVIHLMGLDGFERTMPDQLSGGMAQRVALARTLVSRPEVLLMDEPFSALDTFTRMAMEEELMRIWELMRVTTVFVTHNVDEAIYLGDRVVIFSPRPGRIRRLLDVPLPRPRDRAHADFFAVRHWVYDELASDMAQPAESETGVKINYEQ